MMTQTIPHKASSDLVDNFIFDSFGNAPIQSLQDKEEFHIFEHLLAHIDYYMCHRKLRAQLDKMNEKGLPLRIGDWKINEVARVYVVISFLAQAYIWGHRLEPVLSVLPNVLAVPLLQAAEVLGCQPIVSYYSTVLANWRYETNDRYNFTHSCENNCSYSCDPFDSTTWINSGVSSTVDEKWFYFASLLVEQHSCAIVPLIKEIYRIIHYSESEQVLETDNNATLEHFLRQLQGHLRRMIDSFKKVRESCLPAVFYNSLRKYLSGPRGYPAHFPNEQIQFGDRCVELDNHQIFEPVKKSLFGASAGQSPLIHALDALFGILHDQPPGTQPRQTDRDLSQSDEVPYLLQMRSYMISSHRNFLTWIESWPISLRLYIQTTATEPFDALTVDSTGTLKLVFNDCIKELDRFRKIHYGVVVEYIINQAHIEDGVLSKGNENAEKADSNVKGTGGTDLVSFLTKVRAAVPRALLDLQ